MKPLEGQTYIPDKSFFRPDLIVTDVVYAPRETAMLKMAKEVGCKTMNGLGMMLFQGAAAFEMWTGKANADRAYERSSGYQILIGTKEMRGKE